MLYLLNDIIKYCLPSLFTKLENITQDMEAAQATEQSAANWLASLIS